MRRYEKANWSMADSTLAEIVIGLARQDLLAFRKLADDRDMGNAVLGFHARRGDQP